MLEITKEFKSCLKKADTVTVRIEDNVITFSTIVEAKKVKGWTKDETRNDFSYENKSYINMDDAWFYMPYANGNTVGSLYYLLKIGDKIKFSTMDNSNDYLKDASLHCDELIVSVYRNEKCIIQRIVLDTSVCKDNTARSIKGNDSSWGR